ncbi:hypothetical protein AO353_24165 [Pseudomonas fluorescens]|uniref:Uncharacterized protein n=1 Tax=Pseudomonas fluorescens TaxID=294 RepID=A0A0N9WNN0_PSEFL|nr:hypothetical protein AO353_24165 [Pseudomonas fluorescens]
MSVTEKIFLNVLGAGVGKKATAYVVVTMPTHQLQNKLILCQFARTVVHLLKTVPRKLLDRAMQARPLRTTTVKMLADSPVGILRLPDIKFSVLKLKHVQITEAPLQLPVHRYLPLPIALGQQNPLEDKPSRQSSHIK